MLSQNFPDTTTGCWVNQYVGKLVEISAPINLSIGGKPVTLKGRLLRIDKFQYRYYAVLNQRDEELIGVKDDGEPEEVHEVHFNVDHIMTIEELEI